MPLSGRYPGSRVPENHPRLPVFSFSNYLDRAYDHQLLIPVLGFLFLPAAGCHSPPASQPISMTPRQSGSAHWWPAIGWLVCTSQAYASVAAANRNPSTGNQELVIVGAVQNNWERKNRQARMNSRERENQDNDQTRHNPSGLWPLQFSQIKRRRTEAGYAAGSTTHFTPDPAPRGRERAREPVGALFRAPCACARRNGRRSSCRRWSATRWSPRYRWSSRFILRALSDHHHGPSSKYATPWLYPCLLSK